MASRILTNSGLEIEQTISTGYLALVVRGIGLVRDTGVQNISGSKYFYDRVTFYSGIDVQNNVSISGNVVGSLNPNADNLYDLGNATGEWRDLWIDGVGRIDNLHVDENAFVTGNLSVLGNTTITGDFLPTNVATNFLPKTDNLYDLGSSSQEFKDLWIDGVAKIDTLNVDENAIVLGSMSVGGNTVFTGSITSSSVTSSGDGSFGRLFITGTGIPTSQTSAGSAGQIVWGNGHLYVCTGTNLWGRTALTGWS